MKSAALLSLGAMSLAGCAAAPQPEQLLAGPPPSLAAMQAQIDADTVCKSEHAVRPLAPDPRRPVVIFRCPATFPKALEAAGVEGACRTMFDINPAGEPVNLETRCVAGARYEQISPEWRARAEEAFRHAAQTATARSRFQPLADAPPEASRSSISQPTRFQFFGEGDFLARPPVFQRPPPAPPLPVDPVVLTG